MARRFALLGERLPHRAQRFRLQPLLVWSQGLFWKVKIRRQLRS